MQIRKATSEDVGEVAGLFDLYRQFYDCEADIHLATAFISERIHNKDSAIFLAFDNHQQAVGFVQLYPSFCSVEAVKIYILYDLYVAATARQSGIATALMNTASAFAAEQGAARVDLLTAHSNVAGQSLYEKLGYQKVLEDFYSYSLVLGDI